MFCPPTLTWKLVNGTGQVVLGQESNGDFHWLSPKALVDAKNGTTRTPVGFTTPALIKLLKLAPGPILG